MGLICLPKNQTSGTMLVDEYVHVNCIKFFMPRVWQKEKNMKKYLAVALAVVMLVACCAVLTACSETFTGTYSYENPWAPGSYYGCKVTVTVGGGKIKSVVVASDEESGWTNLSSGWTDKGIYEAAEEEYIASFKGVKVEDILAAEVEVNAKGVPTSVPAEYAVAGATQTSGRVVLAIQSALGKHTSVGSYSYENSRNPGSYYGCAVKVVVVDGKIDSLHVFSDDETGWHNLTPTWSNRDIYLTGEEAFLASFIGVEVADILAIEVTCKTSGAPETVGSETHMVTGATQSCGRVILAIQDALGE